MAGTKDRPLLSCCAVSKVGVLTRRNPTFGNQSIVTKAECESLSTTSTLLSTPAQIFVPPNHSVATIAGVFLACRIRSDFVRSFLNQISGFHQTEEPVSFHGGIVADQMGLGKTLTMISLAAADVETDRHMGNEDDQEKSCVSATLIIIPPPRTSTSLASHQIENRV